MSQAPVSGPFAHRRVGACQELHGALTFGVHLREWRNGRRASFRCWCPKGRGGSSPPSRTADRAQVRFGLGESATPNADSSRPKTHADLDVSDDPQSTDTQIDVETIEGVPPDRSLTSLHQHRTLASRLGRIAEAPAGIPTTPASFLQTFHAGIRSSDLEFPVGVETRRLDADGRFKVQWVLDDGVTLAEILGWESGALEVVMVAGWMVLTQPAVCVGAKPRRNGCQAKFSSSSSSSSAERVSLKPAHLIQLALRRHRAVLVAPVPEHGALIVTNPITCLAGAPGHVATVLGRVPAAAECQDPAAGPTHPTLTLITGATS